jgi:hypothetical protein
VYIAYGEGRGVLTLNRIKEAGPCNINTNTNTGKNRREERKGKIDPQNQVAVSN